jgi:hypothetical protein
MRDLATDIDHLAQSVTELRFPLEKADYAGEWLFYCVDFDRYFEPE